MKIVVLAGGLSNERNVSLSSGAMICEALVRRGHRAVLVDVFLGLEDYAPSYERVFDVPPPLPARTVGCDAPDLAAVRAMRRDRSASQFGPGVLDVCFLADLVFLGLHGACGEDGRIQAAFDLLGIRYTGSGHLGSAIAMDKDFTKRIVRAGGIRTPDWQTVTLGSRTPEQVAETLPLPCVVKAPDGGSSIGVYLCHDRAAAADALRTLAAEGERMVVEAYIKGREFSCGVLDGTSLPPIEIIPGDGFYDYRNKYQQGAALEVCPAQVDGEIERVMRAYAEQAHALLGLTAYSRSDFLLDEQTGEVFFLEVNTLPGMTPTSLLPQEAAAAGIDYDSLCQTIVDIALNEPKRK